MSDDILRNALGYSSGWSTLELFKAAIDVAAAALQLIPERLIPICSKREQGITLRSLLDNEWGSVVGISCLGIICSGISCRAAHAAAIYKNPTYVTTCLINIK